MEDKKDYDQLNSKDLDILNNKTFDIKRSLKVGITKIIKDLEYEFPEDTSQGDKCFGECVKLINIKADLTNLLNDLDTGINHYIELEKSVLDK